MMNGDCSKWGNSSSSSLLFLLVLFLEGRALPRQGQKGIFLQNWALPDSNPPKNPLQFFRRHSKHCVPCGIDFSGLPAHTDFFFSFFIFYFLENRPLYISQLVYNLLCH